MKAIIQIDVPDYQIGQEVSIYFKDIMMIKGIVQEPSGDAISRQAVLERLKKEDKILYTTTGLNYLIRAIGELPSVKPQEPCEDAISRKRVMAEYCMREGVSKKSFVDIINELPSVNPQEPKTDVLDKTRAEIHETAEMHEDGNYYLRDEWIDEYFDKYKAESEDK